MVKKQKLKPELPLGFQDKQENNLQIKNKLIEDIKKNFSLFGFEELETSSFEFTENLGKFLPDEDRPENGVFSFKDGKDWISLRYDLTAPLSRYVAKNFDNLPRPFKRFQVGTVFRNEKPGPGRYREFNQIDADIVGSANRLADAELCVLLDDTFKKIGLSQSQYTINISNRKLIQGLFEEIKLSDAKKQITAIRAIDKLDRLGLDGVIQLLSKGRKDRSGDFTKGANLKDQEIEIIVNFLKCGSDLDKAKQLSKNKIFNEGIEELKEIFSYLNNSNCSFAPTLVRGIEYYTGPIFEAVLTEKIKNNKGQVVEFGSVGGGGRYDNLISRFKGTEYPATGISIGLDRLIYAIQQIKNNTFVNTAPVVICVLDKTKYAKYLEILNTLRSASINSEIYSGDAGLKAQFKYADKRSAPAIVIFGDDEEKEGVVSVKNLKQGKLDSESIKDREEWKKSEAQIKVKLGDLVNAIKKIL